MSTGLDTFDKTVQESNLWLKDVMEWLDTRDRHHAYSTLRAVLHPLRDRIGPESAAHLGAQLPMLLRGLFYEGVGPYGNAQQGASRAGVPRPYRQRAAARGRRRGGAGCHRRVRCAVQACRSRERGEARRHVSQGAAQILACLHPGGGAGAAARRGLRGAPVGIRLAAGGPNIVRRTPRTRGRCSAALALLSP